MKKNKKLSISLKLILVQTIIIIFAFTLFTYLIVNISTRTMIEASEKSLQRENQRIADMITTYDKSLTQTTEKLASIFTNYFKNNFNIDANKILPAGELSAPVLKTGNTVLNSNFDHVDKLSSETGVVATIFVRKGDDFIRITTSLKKEDGSRAMGTMLDRTHPAYQKLLLNESYSGKAKLFGKYYMTRYTPVMINGKVNAVLFVGLDFSEGLKDLKDNLRSIKIGETGYVFVMEASEGKDKGLMQVHPSKEGVNLLEQKSSDGKEVFKEMAEKKEGIIFYEWINTNLGETKPREKITVYSYYKNWGWVIASGSYLNEFLHDSVDLKNSLIGFSILAIVIVITALYLSTKKWVATPLKLTVNMTGDLASGNGDLTKRLDTGSGDELSFTARNINIFVERIQNIIMTLSNDIITLSQASKSLSKDSDFMSEDSNSMNNAISNMTKGIEYVSESISNIATSTTELQNTVREISKNCHIESEMANKAKEQSITATEIMSSLDTSAKEIGKIVQVINDISAQTNLLALNATIEAARAGEAGKGFAVVANEVKELSKQTESATVQIAKQIDQIQNNARVAFSSIEEITKVIGDINDISISIAGAVEEQSATISEISNNLNHVNHVSSTEIEKNISEIGNSADNSFQRAKNIQDSALNLSKLSAELNKIVEQFKIK